MFQIIFNELSAAEISALPKKLQLDLLAEFQIQGIKVHRVLHKNTFRDFLFRSKLPVSEDAQLGETREFWKLIEQGEKTRKV